MFTARSALFLLITALVLLPFTAGAGLGPSNDAIGNSLEGTWILSVDVGGTVYSAEFAMQTASRDEALSNDGGANFSISVKCPNSVQESPICFLVAEDSSGIWMVLEFSYGAYELAGMGYFTEGRKYPLWGSRIN